MRLNDIMERNLKDILSKCDMVKLNPISNDGGVVEKIIVEYVPKKDLESVNSDDTTPTILRRGGK